MAYMPDFLEHVVDHPRYDAPRLLVDLLNGQGVVDLRSDHRMSFSWTALPVDQDRHIESLE